MREVTKSIPGIKLDLSREIMELFKLVDRYTATLSEDERTLAWSNFADAAIRIALASAGKVYDPVLEMIGSSPETKQNVQDLLSSATDWRNPDNLRPGDLGKGEDE